MRGNVKGDAFGIAGHSALQDKAKGIMNLGTVRRAGQSGRQDWKEGKALR